MASRHVSHSEKRPYSIIHADKDTHTSTCNSATSAASNLPHNAHVDKDMHDSTGKTATRVASNLLHNIHGDKDFLPAGVLWRWFRTSPPGGR